MASLVPSGKGKQRDETYRFLCTSVLCACCGRGGNCLLLSCQRCPGKASSVYKATKQPRPRSVRSGLICPFSSYHSISTTFTQKGQASRSTRLCRYTNRPKKQHRCSQYDSLGCGIIWMRPLNIIFTEYWIVFLLAGLNRRIEKHTSSFIIKYPCFRKPCFHRQGNW